MPPNIHSTLILLVTFANQVANTLLAGTEWLLGLLRCCVYRLQLSSATQGQLILSMMYAAGSWGCFDEFNRLVPEVLSVCSVQYKCVTDAQKRKSGMPGRGLEHIDASGRTVKVCCCCFGTSCR